MSAEIDETTNAIKSQISMIELNRKNRNEIYHSCLDNYIANLKNEIEKIQKTESLNITRNKEISHVSQTIYDKIIASSKITIRKIKQTSYQKKLFWQDLIRNNAELSSIQIKKEFYEQKKFLEDRYYEAIDAQNAKKIPYALLVGKNKKKQDLRDWKAKNRVFEEKVNQASATLNQWQNTWEKTAQEAAERENYHSTAAEIFELQANTAQNPRSFNNQALGSNFNMNRINPLYEVADNFSDLGFLKNFEKKKK